MDGARAVLGLLMIASTMRDKIIELWIDLNSQAKQSNNLTTIKITKTALLYQINQFNSRVDSGIIDGVKLALSESTRNKFNVVEAR